MPLTFKVRTDGATELVERVLRNATKADMTLAYQVRNDTSPFVPAETLSLDNRTRVETAPDGDGTRIVYPGPYARYLYYGKYMVTENGKGPMHYVDAEGNEVIRYPKGSTLHATDRDLVFSTAVHGQAQSHWFEASKAQNLEKWKKVAERAMKNGS